MSRLRRPVEALIRRSLRTSFHRVIWCGDVPELPPETSVVMYMNHTSFFDGYLGMLVNQRVLHKRTLVWMREWDAFPFFGVAGALPFPQDDARRRASTFRRTVRCFSESPNWSLIYFPEGEMHPPEEPLLPFATEMLPRLDRLLPNKVWLPVAIHISLYDAERPAAYLCAGAPHPTLDGHEPERLRAEVSRLKERVWSTTQDLLPVQVRTQDRWNFSFMRSFFERRLPG